MKYNTKQFHFENCTQTFMADASELGLGVGAWPTVFKLVSHKTGREVIFHLAEGHLTLKRELVSRTYKPVTASDLNCKVTIFND